MEAVTELSSIKKKIKKSDLFQALSDDELDRLLPLCREEMYEAGVAIFLEGDPCESIYIVELGKVALEVNLRIGRGVGETATIDVVGQGGCLCWSGLTAPGVLTATGRCLETTKVIVLDAAELRALVADHPEVGYKIMIALAKVVSLRFERMKEAMGRILSVIFHDLKAPLAAVESYNRLMLGGFIGELNEEQRDMLERSSKRLSELLNLVSNMIDISRISLGDLRAESTSLTKVIEDCVETMRPLAEEKELQLVVETPRELPAILGSPERLKQVFTNLLSNAIKFTPSGGIVTVKAKGEIDNILVEVADTGIGIPAEDLPKIFDGFYRGLDMPQRGAGLGLSITKRIIDGHHGRIWAVSPCPESGKGTKFTFILPRIVAGSQEKIK